MTSRPRIPLGWFALYFVTGLVLASATCALAEPAEYLRDTEIMRPDGIHVLDGSYILNIGEVHVNITNHGLIGSQYTYTLPYSESPSAQWPGGSGHEYLWGAGIWVGGLVAGNLGVTTGQPVRELRPDESIFATIYEAKDNILQRPSFGGVPTGRRLPDPRSDDDGDGKRDEDPLNGIDDDGDGQIDEDFAQIGDQMMTCTMSDDSQLVQELYADHVPLGIQVVQRAAVWETDDLDDMVVFDYEITNQGTSDISNAYLGFYVDGDIQRRGYGFSKPDDLAGFYRGAVRGSDGVFYKIEVAWMADADPVDPLPGYMGTMVLGHTTDFRNYYAPHIVGVNSFQIFATKALVIQNGEPNSDQDRYELMSRTQIDPDRRPTQPGDLKFMISSGPFPHWPRGKTFNYRVGLVMGNGKAEMLRNALRLAELHEGAYFDLDDMRSSGYGGRETKICLGDYPPYDDGSDVMFDYRLDIADEECIGPDPVFGYEVVGPDSLLPDEDGRLCLYVNADNCFECYRKMGEECTIANDYFWTGRPPGQPSSKATTGTGGRETHYPWVDNEPQPPVPPNMRVEPGDNHAELFWDDISEYDRDPIHGFSDFESYRVYRVGNWIRPPGTTAETGPQAVEWSMIQEYDLVNTFESVQNTVIPLGRNTGLEGAIYVPAALTDPLYEGLAEVMETFVLADSTGRFPFMPPVRGADGRVIPGMEPFVPWETYPDVLDTFFAVTERPASPYVVAKRSTRYYHYLDPDVPNGFTSYYSVVASDHAYEQRRKRHEDYWWWWVYYWVVVGYGVESDPGNNQHLVVPSPTAQTAENRELMGANIYVYPNPATTAALEEFQKQPPSLDNPTGVRVVFNNLPAAYNTIKIFTTAGDLVQTVTHDGRSEGGAATWNLMSRNGQEVVSGIYLYVVQSDDTRFETFRDKFVVIR